MAFRREAKFSDCGKYRYWLLRQWDPTLKTAMCIGLNPSTANAEVSDPTIKNLIQIMANNGYGGFFMVNLFALVSPHPNDLRSCPDPLKDNDEWLEDVSKQCQDVIFCWGNFKQAEYRAKIMIKKYPDALCFGKNTNGSPKHPLYLKQTTTLQRFANAKLEQNPT